MHDITQIEAPIGIFLVAKDCIQLLVFIKSDKVMILEKKKVDILAHLDT